MKKAELNMIETIFVLILFFLLIIILISKFSFLKKPEILDSNQLDKLIYSPLLSCPLYSYRGAAPCLDYYKIKVIQQEPFFRSDLCKGINSRIELITTINNDNLEFTNDDNKLFLCNDLHKENYKSLTSPVVIYNALSNKYLLGLLIIQK